MLDEDLIDKLKHTTNPKTKRAIIKQMTKELESQLEREFLYSDKPYDPSEHWQKNMSYLIISSIIKEGKTLKEAYEQIPSMFNKTDEWVKRVKHKTVKPEFQKDVVDQVESNCKDAIEKLTNTYYDKNSLIYAATPNSQFVKVSNMMTLAERVTELEKKVRELDTNDVINNHRLGVLESVMSAVVEEGFDKVGYNKSLAIRYKKMGMSNKLIAKQLDVSPKTIYRWLKEMSTSVSSF